jgi:signal transduction histidine kinase
MCLTIMKAHKGSIVADKRGTGNGTAFRLAFPISTYNLAQAV